MRKVMVIVARALVGFGGAATGVGRIVLERQIASEIDALLADARPAGPGDRDRGRPGAAPPAGPTLAAPRPGGREAAADDRAAAAGG